MASFSFLIILVKLSEQKLNNSNILVPYYISHKLSYNVRAWIMCTPNPNLCVDTTTSMSGSDLIWREGILFFYWRIIALRRCVSFCYMTMWVSYRYGYMPSLLSLPSACPAHPLLHYRALSWAPCAVTASH